MDIKIKEVEDKLEKEAVSREILYDLSEWFGIQESTEEYIRDLQAKTIQMGHYKEYDIVNNFYIAMGYKESECFPTLWDEWNPCQIYIKYLGA